MEFRNKTIFIISYEEWGDMLMSKHHYAVELSKKGNTVYFINRPDTRRRLKRGEIEIIPTHYPNLFSVTTRFIHPYFLKFKFRRLYNYLTKLQIGKIVHKINRYPDVVWSFDAGNTFPLKCFSKSKLRIYMPVDGPFGVEEELLASEKADLILSVTDRILERYNSNPAPKFRLNHGVATAFINNKDTEEINSPLRVGYAGSLVRDDLDVPIFKKIISSHPDKIFEFWGENNPAKSTIHLPQDITSSTKQFLEFLKTSPNVIMHGPVKPEVLAEGLKRMDVLLIAYNIKDDQNHHKVLEYLGAGKVIVSSYMSSYIDHPELIEMIKTKNNNDDLPDLFNSVVNNLSIYNNEVKRKQRIEHARKFTYSTQIQKIENMIADCKQRRKEL